MGKMEAENQVNRASRNSPIPAYRDGRAVGTVGNSITRLSENKCKCLMFNIEQFDGPAISVACGSIAEQKLSLYLVNRACGAIIPG